METDPTHSIPTSGASVARRNRDTMRDVKRLLVSLRNFRGSAGFGKASGLR